MSFDLHIIPECYIDTKLIKALVPPIIRYNHQKGCSTVSKRMQEKFSDDFALGIIDRDKQDLDYASAFDLICERTGQLQLFKHRTKHHYLIFICPAIEKWLISSAEEVGISLASFNLPHNLKQLTEITKTSKSESQDPFSNNFKQLFEALKKSESSNIRILSAWVNHLKLYNYTADLSYLKSIH